MKLTSSGYRRVMEDKVYTDKAVDALLRRNYGSNVEYEVRDGYMLVNGSAVKEDEVIRQAIDMQNDIADRPELNQLYQDRQQRMDTTNGAVRRETRHEDSLANNAMADMAHKYMKQNSTGSATASRTANRNPNYQPESQLPSDQ